MSNSEQVVVFRIGKELFGARLDRVREIIRYPVITTIPRAPEFLAGITNLRGQILPIIDTRVVLGLNVRDITESTRVLVIESSNSQTGMTVDSVNGVLNLEDVSIEPPPPAIDVEIDTKYIKNIIKRKDSDSLIMELDLDLITPIRGNNELKKEAALLTSKVVEEEKEIESVKEIQLVTFIIANEEYGFPIESVREVLRVGYITEVPEVPAYILGVLSVRNTLLPIIDIRKLFNFSSLGENIKEDLSRFEKQHELWLKTVITNIDLSKTLPNELRMKSCKFGRWLEDFRTSSEDLARLIQTIRYEHIELHREAENEHPDEDKLKQLYEKFSLDMREVVDIIESALKEDQKILVVEIKGVPVGFLVDRMQQVIRVPERLIEPPPSVLSIERTKSIKGILKLDEGRRLVLIVDQDKLLDIGEIEKIEIQEDSKEIISEETSDGEIQIITFKVGKEEFGIGIDKVREINRLDKITSIPRAPVFIKGIMNLRGNVIPIIDLRERFGLESVESSENRRVIIVEIEGKLIGLLVDSVSEVLRISKRNIEVPPEVIETDVNLEFIESIGKVDEGSRIILIVDVEKILSSEEKQELENTEKEYLKGSG